MTKQEFQKLTENHVLLLDKEVSEKREKKSLSTDR